MNTEEIIYHNPENIPPDQIPAGYRLLVPEELDGRYSCKTELGARSTDLKWSFCDWSGSCVSVTYIVPESWTIPGREKKQEEKRPESPLNRQEGGNYYQNMAIQPAEFITKNGLSFLAGCVIKRVCRHRLKNGAEDLRKAIHELELMMELEYNQKP